MNGNNVVSLNHVIFHMGEQLQEPLEVLDTMAGLCSALVYGHLSQGSGNTDFERDRQNLLLLARAFKTVFCEGVNQVLGDFDRGAQSTASGMVSEFLASIYQAGDFEIDPDDLPHYLDQRFDELFNTVSRNSTKRLFKEYEAKWPT